MNSLKPILWIALSIVIIMLVVKAVFFLIPIVLVIALVGYLVFKGKELFNGNKKEDTTYYKNESTFNQSNNFKEQEVIDVDFKDVDK